VNRVQLTQTPPTGFTDAMKAGKFNNTMAQALASGDPRYQMKRYDRAGFSRGGAQANQAGIQGAQDMSQGIANAYRQSMDDEAYNANLALQGQVGQEQFGQALGGLQQQQAYAQQMALLQRQQAVMGLLRGLID
jgi:hypothetical protein